MKLIIVRHAQTEWNNKRILQGGGSDIELNDIGIKQSEKTAEILKDEKIDIIISSPMIRAMQTAIIINKYHNLNIVEKEELLERNYGKLEGINYDELTNHMEKIHNEDLYEEYEVERPEMVENRIKKFWKEVKENYFGKTVLLVTHSAITKMLLSVIQEIPIQEIRKTVVKDNASISRIHFGKNKEIIEIEIGYNKHLIDKLDDI